ncbi:MAG: ABC transporter ATP-binding protein, partial [Actinobacteria bacterium]|nr:ABC transporter ATP-binding protein [Actinomycetota bacterium]
PILEVSGLTVRFGGVLAVDDVTFDLKAGEILGVIGPNGAGKRTVFDAISGFVPSRGHVRLDGTDISEFSPEKRSRARLGRSFQDARLFPSLTVAETLAVSLERHMRAHDAVSTAIGAPWVRRAEKKVAKRVDELVELMGLGAFRDKFVSELSTGSRRIVDLAGILAHEPLVLLLDEPSSGIAQRETEALGPLLLHIRQQTGASLLVIEHDMPLITSISDEILALETGAVLTRGTPGEVLSDPRLVAAYLGTDQAVLERSGMRTETKPVRAAAKRPPVAKKKAAAKKPAAAKKAVSQKAATVKKAAKTTTKKAAASKTMPSRPAKTAARKRTEPRKRA